MSGKDRIEIRVCPVERGVLRLLGWLLAGLCMLTVARPAVGQGATPAGAPEEEGWVEVLDMGGEVLVSTPGSEDFIEARRLDYLKPGYRVRTGANSYLLLRTSTLTIVRIPELSDVEIGQVPTGRKRFWFLLRRGLAYFFHRGRPTDIEVRSRTSSGAIRGTEFTAETDEQGGLVINLVDGEVVLSNDQGFIELVSGDRGVAIPGQHPSRAEPIYTINVIQWCLHYPAVLDLDELELTGEERQALQPSLAAYHQGDLLQARALYPAGRAPTSPAEHIYLAALNLALGQVQAARQQLDLVAAPGPPSTRALALAAALRQLIAAVQLASWPEARTPQLATEWLAESYYRQSQSNAPKALEQALDAARKAVEQSDSFGFGWARVAELEFGFGRNRAAMRALEKALALAPRHAPALALQGFLWSDRGRTAEALRAFDEAIAVDSGLADAWLGRGLSRIRQGRVVDGLEDLAVAAAVEPQRSLLRSYLSKAFAEGGDRQKAREEIELAKGLDREDPTPWLYSALLYRQQNRVNQAVRDLERSQDLNENRRVYRSRLLLDQDRAVRGANLAVLYDDAGLTDLSFREAGRAVAADYASYSAHFFLADSYNQLRDPSQVNLRYETPWLSEHLVATLLAPVGAGALSQTVSQQEYSRLFERNRLGLVSLTEYLSSGDWMQAGAQYGRLGNFSYALEGNYRFDNGQRQNNEFEQTTLSFQLKQQITPQDSLFAQALYYEAEGGDVAQLYDPGIVNPDLVFKETQTPLLLAGYHREWSPGQHTLFLFSRLEDTLKVSTTNQEVILTARSSNVVQQVLPSPITQRYRGDLEIYSAELQQIWQHHPHTLIVGGRYQGGDFDTMNLQHGFVADPPVLESNVWQSYRVDFQRYNLYGYYHLQVAEPLLLVAGLSYDYMTFPANHRFAPISAQERSEAQLSPKAGFIWNMTRNMTLRASYGQSLGGVSFDQSFRLEPTQVAGFNQAWRSLIPESVAGASAAEKFETGALEWELQLPSRTYLAARGELLQSTVDRSVGALDLVFYGEPSQTPERLDYNERALTLSLNQLLGDAWSLGAQYRWSEVDYQDDYLDIPSDAFIWDTLPGGKRFQPHQDVQATLHRVNLFLRWNHSLGFFAGADALWFSQNNKGYQPDLPGDDFWQFNAFVGYRLPQRRAELRLGLLNIADQDYRLNPLNLTAELPRRRTFAASLRFNF